MVNKRDFQRSCCTLLSLPDGDLAGETVLFLFGFFHRRWPTTSLLLIPRFNRGDMLRLSSVLVHIYLHLKSPLPQVHTPDRPSGEPPTGHQPVWSIEALGDIADAAFSNESDLSTHDRWDGCLAPSCCLSVYTVLHSFCAARHICFLLCFKEPCNDVLWSLILIYVCKKKNNSCLLKSQEIVIQLPPVYHPLSSISVIPVSPYACQPTLEN